jgi:hypothetical protein
MNFDEIMADWQKEKQQERDAATIKLKQMLVDRPDIAKINITYDGYGDSGCFDARSYSDNQGNNVEADFLNDAVEEYVCAILPGGWEINEGSYGQVEIDIATFKSKVVHNERVLEEITTEFEV